MKCIVEGCTNHQHEGAFVGDICRPCYAMITTGKRSPSNAWFAKPWVWLTTEEIWQVCWTSAEGGITGDREDAVKAAERMLKEKNYG